MTLGEIDGVAMLVLGLIVLLLFYLAWQVATSPLATNLHTDLDKNESWCVDQNGETVTIRDNLGGATAFCELDNRTVIYNQTRGADSSKGLVPVVGIVAIAAMILSTLRRQIASDPDSQYNAR